MLRKLITVMFALVCNIVTNAQNVTRKGNMFIEQPRATAQAHKTDSIFVDKNGNKFPIYKSVKGKLYIIKISKKTGKEYKRYLSLKESPNNKVLKNSL